MYGTYGIISLLPVLTLIVVALITKRTFESLLVATLLALIIGYKGYWFSALVEQLQMVAAENIWVLLVVGLLGGLVGVFEKSRVAMGFANVLSRFGTTKKNASLIENAGAAPEGGSGVLAYIQSIPFMFYPMFCLLILLLVIAGVIPLFGPIRRYQKQAEETGQLYPETGPVEAESTAVEDADTTQRKTGGMIDFILPILVLLVATVYFDIDVLPGIMIALVFTCILYIARKLMSISEFVDTVWEGFSTMISVLALLVIAFLFKAACENLGMSEYIISKVAPLMAGQALPFVVFLVSTLMTFALANAWGVSAIMVPFVIPLAQAIDANLAVAIAAIFSGSVCGTQLCFYSDNSILIGQATGIQPLDHVKTQMPFALCAAALTSITYLAYGFLFLG